MKGFQNPKLPFHLAQIILINDTDFTLPKSRILTDLWSNVHTLTHLSVTINVQGYGEQPRLIKNILRNHGTSAMKANENTLTSVTWYAPTKHIMQVLRELPLLSHLKLKIFDDFHIRSTRQSTNLANGRAYRTSSSSYNACRRSARLSSTPSLRIPLPKLKSIFIQGLSMNNAMVNFLSANEQLLDLAIQGSDDDPIFTIPDGDTERIVPTFHALRELSTTAHHLQKFTNSLQPHLTTLVLYGETAPTTDAFFSALTQTIQTITSAPAFPSL